MNGKITWTQLDNWFSYHQPAGDQPARYDVIRRKAREFAEAIVENCPAGADATAAVRKVREAAMTANQAIACEEVTGG